MIIHSLKTNTMDTQDEKPKSTQRIPTEIEYHEKGQWAKGERIITVVGGLSGETKRPIGYITLIDYDENKKPILAATDLDGNEWCERSGICINSKNSSASMKHGSPKHCLSRNILRNRK
jgi:hypothetical protein